MSVSVCESMIKSYANSEDEKVMPSKTIKPYLLLEKVHLQLTKNNKKKT